jgi:pimeloyl-ACP methyl ester carboxylesterase
MSKKLSLSVAALLCAATSFSAPICAQPEYSEPLGIALEEYSYPFPVRFLSLENEGQPVRMAFMDVPASTSVAPRVPVVLLHGKNFYGAYWESTIRALAAAGHRVIVPDQIGFGKSSKPELAYSFDLLARNTAQLLDSLGVSKFAIVGHSMGGMLAVRMARTYPARVSQLVLENPIGLEDYRFKVPPQTTERAYQNELANTDSTNIRAFLRRYFVTWKPEYERLVEVRSRLTLGGEWPRWAKSSALTYQMIYQQPVRHEFSLLRVPTLLVIGQSDRTVVGRDQIDAETAKTMGQYPALGRAAARDIAGSKLVELPNVGHIPHLEAPQKFHAALLDFLKPVSASAPPASAEVRRRPLNPARATPRRN